MKSVYIMIVFLLLVGCATVEQDPHKHDKFTQHYENSLFEISKNGVYSVEMVIKDHELKTGINKVDIIIHDKNDHDVVGVDIRMTPWMPTMGHGVLLTPVVTEKGAGLYSLDNIAFSMSGLWELRIIIKANSVEDTVVFSFPDIKVDKEHGHKMSSAPTDLDLSDSKLTDKKIFNVSYNSDADPIPINTFHTWNLKIQSSDGGPISGADISLDGDMPEHGHGLPTEPEVTEEIGNGEYLVEGLKFSMPGWWVMNFTIKAGEKEDKATFNLMLKE